MKKIKYISSRYGHNVGNHIAGVSKMMHRCETCKYNGVGKYQSYCCSCKNGVDEDFYESK